MKQVGNSPESDEEHLTGNNHQEKLKAVEDSIQINGDEPSSVDDTELYEDIDISQYIEEIDEEAPITSEPNTDIAEKNDISISSKERPSTSKSTASSTKTAVKPTDGRKPSKTYPKQSAVDSTKNNDNNTNDRGERKVSMETYEGRTPVEEPLITRKSVSLLYSDDEDENKTTQLIIVSETFDHPTIKDVGELEKQKTQKTTSSHRLITNEKHQNSTSRVKNRISTLKNSQKQPIKKPTLENDQNKIKINGKKNSNRVKQDHKIQNTSSDIDNVVDIKEDEATTRISTGGINDNINNKKKSVTMNLEKTEISKPNVTETPKTEQNVRKVSEKTTNNKQCETFNSSSKTKKLSTSKMTTNTSKSAKGNRKSMTKNDDPSKAKVFKNDSSDPE